MYSVRLAEHPTVEHAHNVTIGNTRYSSAGNYSIDETAGRYPEYLVMRT